MRRAATAARPILLSAALLACLTGAACAPSPQAQAFAAAQAAVRAAPGAPAHAAFQDLAVHDLTGLKGSKAQVVCGTATGATSAAPFIYVWKLDAAVPDPGVRSGQVILTPGALDRRAANQLNHFCSPDTGRSAANPYDYFR